ncbi:LysM peptidoglycan-binding domain-containing protein [Austwickia chelonae]|uniref:LysM peptidoglycan-binding domain-containing protein n=1 Tax=Austwickia chelonae TaxID=100225 RepID=UPI0013C33EF2|nr:LysM peptidoglycan-binding domain-containing protein [Austwickia chelonae]
MTPVSLPAVHAAPTAAVMNRSTAPGRAWITYEVRPGDTLWKIAAKAQVSVTELVARNQLASAGTPLHVGDQLTIPSGNAPLTLSPAAVAAPVPVPAPRTSQRPTHVVRAGESLWDIAHSTGVEVEALLQANKLSPTSVILPGQRLAVPGSSAGSPRPDPSPYGTYVIRPGDTASRVARHLSVDVSTLLAVNNLSSGDVLLPGRRLTVPGGHQTVRAVTKNARTGAADTRTTTAVVGPGDSLWAISGRYGVSMTGLAKANGIGLNHPLKPGDRLQVIGSLAASAAAPSRPGNLSEAATTNLTYLNRTGTPSRSQLRSMIVATAQAHGVDPRLALAIAWQESRWSQNAVSEANAIGVMQCLPSTGQWVSQLIGRSLDLLDPQDNVTCGVALLRSLGRSSVSETEVIAGYYQGLTSVRSRGLFEDTKEYVASVLAYKRQM